MTENDKSKVPEKSALNEARRDSSLESSKLDSQSEPETLQHVQNMKLLANQDSPSEHCLKCPDLPGADREHIQNNRFEIVDTSKGRQKDLDSATMMAISAKSDPAIMPVALLRQYADALPEGHADKGRLTDLSRQQAAALSPEFANRYDRQDGSVLLDIGVSKGDSAPANWLEAGQMIAQLPIEQQFTVIGTALSEGFKQYTYEERERQIGQLIGTVQGVGDVLQFYASISDFAYDIIARREDRLQERGAKFGEALGKTIVAGIGFFKLAHDYCYNIGYSGDYYKPFRDVVSLGSAIDATWKSLPPREQERIKAQLITNLIADGLVTKSGGRAILTLPKMTEILDALALEAKASAASLKNVSAKAANHITKALDDIFKFPPGAGGLRPAYSMAGGAPDLLQGVKEVSKGWRDKLDNLVNAMSGDKKERLKKVEKFESSKVPTERKSKLAIELEPFKFPSESKLPVLLQQDDFACTFSCAEMLSNGKLKQFELAKLYRDSLNPQFLEKNPLALGTLEFLAEQLGPQWFGGFKYSHLGDVERFRLIQKHNTSWAAEFKTSGDYAHVVVVDGYSRSGRILIRDPADAKNYELELDDFMKFWTLRGVYHDFQL